ncbi:hypothetical protein HPB49_001336 [Dermacentor silvarum]|uniref:Uncharacterized protein n=1 Tax=Dermacentor silvarum TaxID=543639 RepID=A0ACB8D9V1_DERSI|nr:hypothetical protein HPB49_001336 [Dermacentor silvarum]
MGLDELGHVVFFQAVLFGGDAADHSHDLESGLLETLDGVCASAVLLYVEAEDADAIYCGYFFAVDGECNVGYFNEFSAGFLSTD